MVGQVKRLTGAHHFERIGHRVVIEPLAEGGKVAGKVGADGSHIVVRIQNDRNARNQPLESRTG